jgi:glutaredoxin 3
MGEVVVYSKLKCPQCVVVKTKLKARGVPFKEVLIDEDAELRAWLMGQGHRSVPQVYVDGVHTNPDALAAETFID